MRGIIGEAESAKVKRSMYAETQTEKVWVTRDERLRMECEFEPGGG